MKKAVTEFEKRRKSMYGLLTPNSSNNHIMQFIILNDFSMLKSSKCAFIWPLCKIAMSSIKSSAMKHDSVG